MKIRVNWLFPEVFHHNEKAHRIFDVRFTTSFTYEWQHWDGNIGFYAVLRILGLGLCISIIRKK